MEPTPDDFAYFTMILLSICLVAWALAFWDERRQARKGKRAVRSQQAVRRLFSGGTLR